MVEEKPALSRQQYDRSLSTLAKWNVLRVIGNSTIGKAAILVPVLGYFLLFNREVVDFLKFHSSLCNECTISWRLHFLYFGSFFVGLGSVLFRLACPVIPQRHATANDFYEAEKDYYAAPAHLTFLTEHILGARSTTYMQPELSGIRATDTDLAS